MLKFKESMGILLYSVMKDEQLSIMMMIIIIILNLSSENTSKRTRFLSPVSHNDGLTVFSSNLFTVIRSSGLISIKPRSVSPSLEGS